MRCSWLPIALQALWLAPLAGCRQETYSPGQLSQFGADSGSDSAGPADAAATDSQGPDVGAADAPADSTCPGQNNLSELAAIPVCLCPLETLLDDSFDNASLATGGTGGGFTYVAYGFADPTLGSVAEYDGAMHLTTPAKSGGAEPPEVAAHSIAPFAAHPEGLTAVLQVAATAVPSQGGITLALQSKPGTYQQLGTTGLELHILATKAAVSGLTLGGQNNRVLLLGRTSIPGGGSGFELLGYSDYNPDALTDGFAAVLAVGPAGWRYRMIGLSGTPIEASGVWKGQATYEKSLDTDNFIGVSIQGEADDSTGRKVDVNRVQLLRGVCTP